ncbi:MAG: endonuclease/exonuclease/phosphatase family protein [Bacteroidia bacterium]|nr:endonuclease/exonuclease/phosphatase family protein [Bacteroidia bacterium]
MKGLKIHDKLIFLINSIAAALLLFAYILPYLSPKSFALVSVLSLGVPLLILINALFALYWLLKVKRPVFLSVIVLLIGFRYIGSLYKFSGSKDSEQANQISLMSFNVRLFNVYDWIDSEGISKKAMKFISSENPDIVCFQEFHPDPDVFNEAYPYKFEDVSGERMKHGQAIWSKYDFLNKGSITFENTANSAIYADLITGSDTIRVYNVHLQSSGISSQADNIDQNSSKRLLKRVTETFKMQQDQAEKVVAHMKSSPYKIIVCGDFNNTAYSYVYNLIKGDLNDAFEVGGHGFGRTFAFRYFPVRIDFILSDQDFSVNGFKTYDIRLSDHFPIKAELTLDSD